MGGFFGYAGKHDYADEIIGKLPSEPGYVSLRFGEISLFISRKGSGKASFSQSGDGRRLAAFYGALTNRASLLGELNEKTPEKGSLTDCDLILRLYESHGPGMINKLRGMFAFAVYDETTRVLLCARDQFGIKPMYFSETEPGDFLFGTELGAFLCHPSFKKTLNDEALAPYLTFQYSALPETFFKGAYRLLPGHYFNAESGKATEIARYFTPGLFPNDVALDAAVGSIDAAVTDSIKKHFGGAQKTGVLLSGGVDSSYMAAVAAKLAGKNEKLLTFSVGFGRENYDETDYARDFAKQIGAKNTAKIISADEYFKIFPHVQRMMDEPLADPAGVALYFACEEASKHVGSVISGEGADEFFGGYNIYKEPGDLNRFAALPVWLKKIFKAAASVAPFGFKGKNFIIRGG
ncbi:MAG: asparagine synthetase B, partial [Defluviitaleaceae bacterium]|nr:asparagine synthetase B [Defluviitaleaceae bacterium]